MNAKKLVRDVLRMKLLAGGKPGEYALYVSPLGIKVALASDYNLAMLAGMEDFWKFVPDLLDGLAPESLPPFDDKPDPDDRECRFTRIFDGYGNTYVAGGAHAVPKRYTCLVATPEEIRQVVDYAKRKAERGNDGRTPSCNDFTVHGGANSTKTIP